MCIFVDTIAEIQLEPYTLMKIFWFSSAPLQYFSIFHKAINGSYMRCQKKLPSFAITSNFHSVQKSKWVLKGKCLVTRSGKTDEKYDLWWKTSRCMFYWHDKCGKTRCGIPYNIILNVLKYIFPLKEPLFFFFQFLFLSFCQASRGPGQESLWRIFLQKMYRILHHDLY